MEKSFYSSVGLPEPVEKIHQVDPGDHIIQHFKHSFDKTGKVIVVDADKEDLWESIPQYQDEVGAKNVIRMIEAGGDPLKLLNANESSAFYGDVTEMTADGLNELSERNNALAAKAVKALDDFNKKYGTTLSMDEFIRLTDNGLLKEHVEGFNSKEKEEGSTDGEK